MLSASHIYSGTVYFTWCKRHHLLLQGAQDIGAHVRHHSLNPLRIGMHAVGLKIELQVWGYPICLHKHLEKEWIKDHLI